MAHSATRRLQVGSFSGMSLLAAFDAGRLTSDGGLVWLAEADRVVGVCDALAACIPEWRRGPVVHSLATLARQRILQIACGYADQNDATTLRSDPLLKWPLARNGRRSGLAANPLTFGERRRSARVRSHGRGVGDAV